MGSPASPRAERAAGGRHRRRSARTSADTRQRRQSVAQRLTTGAIDALLEALAALGTRRCDAGRLPPRTPPRCRTRSVAEGVLAGRRATHPPPPGAPRPAPGEPEALEHEGARSIAALGALLWHAGRGAEDAPALVQWVTPPQTNPAIALTPTGLRTPSVRPVEPGWGGAPEPALHRLLRDWVDEVHERDAPGGAQSPPR